ncbi:zinc knuckle-domain-containing protein [Lasiosphaeria miniovina]|uniref:Zinc knuckle-domain-containing protein n=1 Tax=Lasiosphaeria miniovina TaxID=1954250 RepID=A0AA40B6Q0_9PEZI|nr:zinc knuckle-domain-containing protein [Lasiosphaeria miniovina]KAK0728612.1 zinc knuckle-domain-containing protein [Lasiosphaeria miniovina]
MFSSRRGDASRAAPANVQCQKCLKKGHYSYECKAAPQERPYIARPSRTQQLFNPKLLPKLSNEVPDALQRKKGVADEELAKKEAERAKKRALEEEDEEDTAPNDSPPKRRRSHSYDSVSTISTRSPSPAPPPRRVSRSPPRVKARDLSLSPRPSHSRRRSTASSDGHSSQLSRSPESPERGYSRRAPPGARSPSPPPVRVSKRSRRGGHSGRDYGRAAPAERHYSRSRSPTRSPVGRRDQQQRPNYRDRDNHSQQGTRLPPRREPSPPPRERSLSPFSKRLALTQSMNMGR